MESHNKENQNSLSLFRPEHQGYLQTYISSSLRADGKKAVSVWQKIFPSKNERLIEEKESTMLTKKSDLQVKLVDMMGNALIAEGEMRLQWQFKAMESQIRLENSAIIMQNNAIQFERLMEEMLKIQETYNEKTYYFVDQFIERCEKNASYPEALIKQLEVRDSKALMENLLSLDHFLKHNHEQLRSLAR
jgi:hypothetical protein